MNITLDSHLEAELTELARRQGIDPQQMALDVLRELVRAGTIIEPRDEWERRLLGVARDCGISLPDSALSNEGD